MAVKNQKGKVKVTQTLEKMHTGSSATWGFFWGILNGLIFGGPLFWGLSTALLGGLFAQGRDLGIDNQFIKEVGNSLDPGESALFILAVEATEDKVLPEMAKFAGTVSRPRSRMRMRRRLRKRWSMKISVLQSKKHSIWSKD